MAKLLITGGAGFIGSNFVHYWAENYPEDSIVVLDLLTYAGQYKNIQQLDNENRIGFVKGDIADQELVENILEKDDIDTIVHFAAESHVDRSILGPGQFVQSNVVGTHALLCAAKAKWLDSGTISEHRFHHISTDEVYGSLSKEDPPFTERTPYSPNSPYAASKAASDHLVRAYSHTYGLQVTISNCSNNYGPFQYPEKLIPLMLLNLLNGNELPVYGEGQNVRDWLYVEDHCRAIDAVLKKGKLGEVYNVGGINEWKNIDLVRTLCKKMDDLFDTDESLAKRFPLAPAANGIKSESLIRFVTDRLGHDFRYAIDCSKIRDELGFLPTESFEIGLEKSVSWYMDNEPWWRDMIK